MCTLTLAWQVFADAPVALAANRDEALDRAAEPPAIRDGTGDGTDDDAGNGDATDDDTGDGDATDDDDTGDGTVRYVAPRDAQAGGTWIGLTDDGLVVAVTNRWLDADRDGERSRGLLVRDCLEADSAEDARQTVERSVATRAYDGFNLVIADARSAFLLAYDGALAVTRLDAGVHVVGNVGGVVGGAERFSIPERRRAFGDERAASARAVADALAPDSEESVDAWLDRASAVLADHEYGACLHGDDFGTVSFTRIRTGPDPAFAYADGPPCETDPVSVSLPPGFDTGGEGDSGDAIDTGDEDDGDSEADGGGGVDTVPDDAESQF
ncbi:NRDE family protein [Halorubrum laminariae]|uniref:NRDE family protein n=1 Tax=Halorubrum laminariae TaxID=1433523 RepID=A0ABD6C488_9EURY|nr:NRDE family protein [Halorubrum laminariae]